MRLERMTEATPASKTLKLSKEATGRSHSRILREGVLAGMFFDISP